MVCSVLLVLPVFNNADALTSGVERILEQSAQLGDYDVHVHIVDNGSTDSTAAVVSPLLKKWRGSLTYESLAKKGRGNALRTAWLRADENILCYMDVDIATDLAHLRELLDGITEGNDICIGSRYLPGTHAKRSLQRLVLSKAYNAMARLLLGIRIRDINCGFKAVRRESFLALAPMMNDDHWFFDTEMVLSASRLGMNLKEIPVNWSEKPDSKVDPIRDIPYFLKKMLLCKWGRVKRT